MTEHKVNKIPHRQRCIDKNHPYTGGARDIYDDVKEKSQEQVNKDVDDALDDRYTKDETYSQEQLDSMITTPEIDYKDYDTYAEMLAETEHPNGAIYRVANYDGTQVVTNKYAEYSWDGSQYKLMAVRDHGIATKDDFDNPDVAKRAKIPTVGAVADVFGNLVENPEYKEVCVDSEDKIYEGITKDDEKLHFLKETFKNEVTFEKKATFKEVSSSSDYYVNNPQFSELIIDSEEHILESRDKKTGAKTFDVPVIFNRPIYIGANVLSSFIGLSSKYAKVINSYNNVIGSFWSNARHYCSPYCTKVYDVILKLGIPFLRDYINNGEQDKVLYEHGVGLMFMANIGNVSSNSQIIERVEYAATNFDGNIHHVDSESLFGEKTIQCRIDYFQGFNEPDLKWTYPADATEEQKEAITRDYFNKTKLIYNTAKAIRPDLKIVIGVFSNLTCDLFKELLTIRDEEGKAFWDYGDIIDFHHYAKDYTSLEQKMQEYQSMCNSAYAVSEYSHLKDKPLMMSEFGTAPFVAGNVESVRHKLIVKQALTYLSYGIEKVILHRSVAFNLFATTTPDNYYGIINPVYFNANTNAEAAWAGFMLGNGDSITPDGLLDKTYILNEGDADYYGTQSNSSKKNMYSPNIITRYLQISTIQDLLDNGLSFRGKGFVVEKLFIADKITNESSIVDDFDANVRYDYYFDEENSIELWSDDNGKVMDGTDSIDISAADLAATGLTVSDFTNKTIQKSLVAKVRNVEAANVMESFDYFDSYYSVKCLASMISDIASSPNINKFGTITIVSWKTKAGTTNYALWNDTGSVGVEFETSSNVSFYTCKGVLLSDTPTSVDDSPLFVINSDNLNIKL